MTATTLARSTPNTTDLTQAVVNTNLGRKSSPPTLEKTDEASEPGAGLGNDSGYASLSNTPDRPTSSVSSFSQEGVTLSGRKLFQPAITKLKGFDQEIPESVRDRFLDLKELFDGPLYDYLSKLKVNVGDVSIKLKILGESEGTAKPWIVVQCEKDVSRMVKLFFKQKHVRVVYQPRDQSSDLPYFEILFCDRLLRRNADDDNIEVYSCAGTDIGIRRTLCGTLIKVSEGQESCTATLGGVVLVKKSGKSPQLYAITAGHVLRPVQGEHEGSQTSYQGGYGEDDFLSDDEDNFELDGELEEEDDAVEDLDKPGTYSWSKIGHVFDASLDMPSTHYNLDWTLFTIDDPKHYRPNLLVELADDTSRYHNVGHLGTLSSSERQIQSGQEVVVLSGTGGNKKGSISIRNSFLMLAPGKRFVDTYDLTLTDGSKLSAGDSGSWVVDQKSFEVYGHVVATDAFGEALVIPMKSTLQDIKDRFAMDEVSIPDVTQVECCQLEIMATVRPTSSELLSSRSVVVGAAAVSKNLNSDIHQFQQQADPSDHSDILETFAHLRSESERPTSRREWREVSSPDPLAKPQAQDGHKHYHESGQSQTSSDKPTLPIPQEQPEPHSSWLTAAPNVALEPMVRRSQPTIVHGQSGQYPGPQRRNSWTPQMDEATRHSFRYYSQPQPMAPIPPQYHPPGSEYGLPQDAYPPGLSQDPFYPSSYPGTVPQYQYPPGGYPGLIPQPAYNPYDLHGDPGTTPQYQNAFYPEPVLQHPMLAIKGFSRKTKVDPAAPMMLAQNSSYSNMDHQIDSGYTSLNSTPGHRLVGWSNDQVPVASWTRHNIISSHTPNHYLGGAPMSPPLRAPKKDRTDSGYSSRHTSAGWEIKYNCDERRGVSTEGSN